LALSNSLFSFLKEFGPLLLPLVVLLSSLAGSAHCGLMCGPLLLASTKNSSQRYLYHFGRLFTYLALGALAGAFGGVLFLETYAPLLALFTALFLSFLFIGSGIQVWTGRNTFSPLQRMHRWLWQQNFMQTRNENIRSLLIGASSGILPCGWLYSFVLAALATRSLFLGVSLLFFFWLGTLPILNSLGWGLEKLAKPLREKFPKLIASALIFTGLLILPIKLLPLFSNSSTALQECHLPLKAH